MDFEEKLLEEYNLKIEEYENLLQDCKNKIEKVIDIDWSEIAEKYNISFNADTIRKGMQPPLIGGSFIMDYYNWKLSHDNSDESYLTQLRLEKEEIRKEKMKLFDERIDLNRRLRKESRLETTIEKIEQILCTIANVRYPEIEDSCNFETDNLSDSDMIVMLSDLHIGAEYYHFTGSYNTDIAKKRLHEYKNNIIQLKDTHKTKNCHVVLLGDLISGNIHKTISVTNKENVIEQVKTVCDYLSTFLYDLSPYFENVYVYSVAGNHSRLEDKESALNDERLDSLIVWFLDGFLRNVKNIHIKENANLDNTLFMCDIKGHLYFGVHGDYDNLTSKSRIENLSSYIGFKPYAILCGHKHYPLLDYQTQPIIAQCGCLGGSGDEFTVQKRLRGMPSQTVLIVDNTGIKSYHPIFFS